MARLLAELGEPLFEVPVEIRRCAFASDDGGYMIDTHQSARPQRPGECDVLHASRRSHPRLA